MNAGGRVPDLSDWIGPEGEIGQTVAAQSEACLRVYREDPSRIEEDARIEIAQFEGGYQRSQVFELLQNATDAMRGSPGRISIVRTVRALYVANQGAPFTSIGVATLLASHLSRKSEKDIGQFGLGFKSVLALTEMPEVYSRTGSFKFERETARNRIQLAGLRASLYPTLRLAEAVEPADAASSDDVLRELMVWATTVVKLPLRPGQAVAERVETSLAAIPGPFLLFAPQVRELVIDDRTGQGMRVVRAHRDADVVELVDNEDTTRWHVVTRVHRLTKHALKDAGSFGNRTEVEVSWAAPLDVARIPVGEFWAYFPTGLRTTLSGIVNAPWKLNADRTQMLDGFFNRELLVGVLPDVVVQSLPNLATAQDLARVLDLLPARGREARSFGDEVLNDPVMTAVAAAPSLPVKAGSLQRPAASILAPVDISPDWWGLWQSPDAEYWVAETVNASPERRAKAERLISTGRGSHATLTRWIEAVVTDSTPSASARALRLASRIVTQSPQREREVRAAKIVLLEDGSLAAPKRGQVFVRDSDSSSGHDFVHPELLTQPGLTEDLKTLGIDILNPAGQLRHALQRQPEREHWAQIWPLVSGLQEQTCLQIFREELSGELMRRVFVRVRSGKWKPLALTFLPGEVVQADSNEDADFVVDPRFHMQHLDLLRQCGGEDAPRLRHGLEEPWVRTFKEQRVERYRARFKGTKPGVDKVVVSGPDLPWPLETLPLLSHRGKAAVTAAVMRLGLPGDWTVSCPTNAQFDRQGIKSPVAHRIHSYGVLPTSVGLAEVDLCLHPEADVPRCFPIASIDAGWASLLRLSEGLADWTLENWQSFIADTLRRRGESAGLVYAEAARHGVPCPPSLLVHVGQGQRGGRRPDSVAVTDDSEILRSLVLAGIPTLEVPTSADRETLVQSWGLADGRDMLREQVVPTPDSDPVLLIDRFPPLRLYDAEIPELEVLAVQTCSAIDVLVSTPQGQVARPSQQLRMGSVLLVRNGTDADVLKRVSELLQVRINVSSVLEQMAQQASDARILEIRAQENLPEKLVIAVGPDALRAHVPEPALADLEQSRELSPEELAELVLTVHGLSTLQELRMELSEAGLNPPTQWSGGREARQFVSSLGFPAEYAGFTATGLPPAVTVEGQVFLPKLHGYQELVIARIRDLMGDPRSTKRGMVTLPTGAGKTRVAVEAAVRLATDNKLRGPVVWIGQTDELCEQAVQAWAYVWRALGRGPMEVSRFWAGRDVDEAPLDCFQVVVCTVAKLQNAIDKERYSWLVDPALIIIDEAHTSVAPSYTAVLHWLTGTKRLDTATTPLLGLTATAYRGHSAEETKRLVQRYGGNKLDEGVFESEDPYAFLQRRGILARVRQKALVGVDIQLSEKDRDQFEQTRRLPQAVEAAVGRDPGRNRRIIESVMAHPDDWTILLFASSVENASALAAELSYYGVSARPINSGTDSTLRRRYIEQFRAGDIRVLTNYNVLTQGFDAPQVQAVYVTRPTFSPNLYQQMVGRGLRGPRNGGSEEVLIVNVADNLVQYGDQLAFHHFDHLWTNRD